MFNYPIDWWIQISQSINSKYWASFRFSFGLYDSKQWFLQTMHTSNKLRLDPCSKKKIKKVTKMWNYHPATIGAYHWLTVHMLPVKLQFLPSGRLLCRTEETKGHFHNRYVQRVGKCSLPSPLCLTLSFPPYSLSHSDRKYTLLEGAECQKHKNKNK